MKTLSERHRLHVTVIAGTLISCAIAQVTLAIESREVSPRPAVTVLGEPNELRWDLTSRFEFDWDSVSVSGRILKGKDLSAAPRTVTVSVTLNILDANDLLAVDANKPIVLAVLDGDGAPVQWQAESVGNTREYDRVGVELVREDDYHYVDRLVPSSTRLELALDSDQPTPSSISSIRGYLHALFADDLISVDIPYNPDGGWLDQETVPDLMLCVDPSSPCPPGPVSYDPISASLATQYVSQREKIHASYYYMTWVKSKTESPVMALEDVWYPPEHRALVKYVVVETQLVDSSRNKVMRFPTMQTARSDAGRGAFCHGWPGQDQYNYDTIRHIIGVHPVEVKVPFVLTSIPVPSVQPTGDNGR